MVTDDRRQRGHRHPLGRQPLDGLGPPRLRRRLRRRVPPSGRARSSRRATGRPSSRWTSSPLRVRWLGLGPLPRRARRSSTVCSTAARRPPARCSSTRTSTRSALRTDPAHVLVDPASVGARARAGRPGRRRDLPRPRPARRLPDPDRARRVRRTGLGRARSFECPTPVAYVRSVEQLLIDTLADFGLSRRGRLAGYPGVWVGPDTDAPRKIAAIGVRHHAGSLDARLRAQRATRHGDVRAHRPVWHRRQGRSRRWPPKASTCRMREVVDVLVARRAWSGGARPGPERQTSPGGVRPDGPRPVLARRPAPRRRPTRRWRMPRQPGPAGRGRRDRGRVDLGPQARLGACPRPHQRRLPAA